MSNACELNYLSFFSRNWNCDEELLVQTVLNLEYQTRIFFFASIVIFHICKASNIININNVNNSNIKNINSIRIILGFTFYKFLLVSLLPLKFEMFYFRKVAVVL